MHLSFSVVKEPPYSVSESGYAGFIMPIDVYFRSREEPKRVTFKYDLYLRLEPSPVNNIRIEKLTFNNPSDDFRNKLIRAGGVSSTFFPQFIYCKKNFFASYRIFRFLIKVF